MLQLTKMSDYAVALLAQLAREPEQAQSARQAALAAGLPEPTVKKLLKELAHARLVVSERGAGGGYRLGRSPRSIRIAEIVESLEGQLALTRCSAHPQPCGQFGTCRTRPGWFRVNDALRRALGRFTLADMLADGSPPPGARIHDHPV